MEYLEIDACSIAIAKMNAKGAEVTAKDVVDAIWDEYYYDDPKGTIEAIESEKSSALIIDVLDGYLEVDVTIDVYASKWTIAAEVRVFDDNEKMVRKFTINEEHKGWFYFYEQDARDDEFTW